MNKQHGPILFQSQTPWSIRRPNLYRYLEKKYVDEFFDTGALRISSFSHFAKHNDAERQDTKEGKTVAVNVDHKGKGQTIFIRAVVGSNAYVFCTSTLHSKDISEAFKTNSGFRIDNIIEFGKAIARYIPGCVAVGEGSCIYSPNKQLVRNLDAINSEDLENLANQNAMSGEKLKKFYLQLVGDDGCYLKDDKYAHQNEYRMLWVSPRDVEGYLDIQCPEATNFCTRFEDFS